MDLSNKADDEINRMIANHERSPDGRDHSQYPFPLRRAHAGCSRPKG